MTTKSLNKENIELKKENEELKKEIDDPVTSDEESEQEESESESESDEEEKLNKALNNPNNQQFILQQMVKKGVKDNEPKDFKVGDIIFIKDGSLYSKIEFFEDKENNFKFYKLVSDTPTMWRIQQMITDSDIDYKTKTKTWKTCKNGLNGDFVLNTKNISKKRLEGACIKANENFEFVTKITNYASKPKTTENA
jgi:hypothetical protein